MLSASLATAQDAAPGDPDAALSPEMRAALQAIDPALDGWTSEAQASAASRSLREVGVALGAQPSVLEAMLIAGAEVEGLVPDAWTTTFDDGNYHVRRGVEDASAAPPAVAFREGLEALGAAWLDGAREVECKIVGVSATDGGFSCDVLFHAFGRAAADAPGGARWLERTAVWRVDFRERPDAPDQPRIAHIRGSGVEDVFARAHAFADDRDAFASLPGFLRATGESAREFGDFGWGEGMNELRARMDARLGLPLVGAPSGVAVADVDGDGYDDVYLCQPGGLPNRLLLGEEGRFVDLSAGSGTDYLDFSRSALLIDLDDDGDPDLVVSVGAELLFLSNDGEGVFTPEASFSAPESTSLAAADFDLDGDLDVYACVYFTPYEASAGGGVPRPYHDAENGQANLLLENRGDFSFVDVAALRGMTATRFSFAAAWEDYDRDGDPDLYVANDFGRNNLYRNDVDAEGERRFVDVAASAGVEDISAGMGVAWGDYDGDGLFDLYVSNMFSSAGNRVAYQARFHADDDAEATDALRRHARGNSLFRNRGDGTFEDVSVAARVTMGRWAWGARFVDLNADGRLDLFSPNGFLTGKREHDL